jgi:hypothetical protein
MKSLHSFLMTVTAGVLIAGITGGAVAAQGMYRNAYSNGSVGLGAYVWPSATQYLGRYNYPSYNNTPFNQTNFIPSTYDPGNNPAGLGGYYYPSAQMHGGRYNYPSINNTPYNNQNNVPSLVNPQYAQQRSYYPSNYDLSRFQTPSSSLTPSSSIPQGSGEPYYAPSASYSLYSSRGQFAAPSAGSAYP